jgi:RNA polymerase sigma-70 factor (ECF subfamily)
VLAAQAGDRKATAALLAELLPRVRNLVRYLVRGDANVDDIAQESLIAIVRGLPSYRAEGHFHSFTDRIVARTALAWLRRERRTKERERESVRKDSMPGGSEAPDQYTLRRQAVARLERLPDEQRQAVVLHHVVGLSVPEVAAQFGVSQETIRSRLRLAQAKLQELARQENGSARPEVES